MTAPRRRPVTPLTRDQILAPGDPAPQTGPHLCRPPSPLPRVCRLRARRAARPRAVLGPRPSSIRGASPTRPHPAWTPPAPQAPHRDPPARGGLPDYTAHPLLRDQSRLLRPQDWRASAGWGGPLGRLSGCGPRKRPWSGGRPRSRSRRAHEGRVLKLLCHLALEKFQ